MSEYHFACPDCLGMMEKHMVYYIDCSSSNMGVVSVQAWVCKGSCNEALKKKSSDVEDALGKIGL